MHGGEGADELFGDGGRDTASYADASQGLIIRLELPKSNTGDASGDSYSSIENVIGSSHDDTIYGNGGANTLEGGDGNDSIAGSLGDDALFGGLGDDSLAGGGGADIVDGGEGFDTVTFEGFSGVVASLTDGIASYGTGDSATLAGVERLVGTDAADDLSAGLV
ncbi:MAG: hypothetical protein AAFZ07_30325, partial [Actinomycetota bacterium]